MRKTQIDSTGENVARKEDIEDVDDNETPTEAHIFIKHSENEEDNWRIRAKIPVFGESSPILKWAGGKREQAPAIADKLMGKTKYRSDKRYLEPFLGGASVFLHLYEVKKLPLQPSILSDKNRKLIELYTVIRDDAKTLFDAVNDMMWDEWDEDYYYKQRDIFNEEDGWKEAEGAARFIWLNKHCFNGLYRENARKKFNVPCGKFKSNPVCPTESHIQALSLAFTRTELVAGSFFQALQKADKGDRVYCDPPYAPLMEGGFVNYAGEFDWDDQVKLAEQATEAAKRGAIVVLSNHNTPEIRELYEGLKWRLTPLEARRRISRTGDRTPAKEVMIWR